MGAAIGVFCRSVLSVAGEALLWLEDTVVAVDAFGPVDGVLSLRCKVLRLSELFGAVGLPACPVVWDGRDALVSAERPDDDAAFEGADVLGAAFNGGSVGVVDFLVGAREASPKTLRAVWPAPSNTAFCAPFAVVVRAEVNSIERSLFARSRLVMIGMVTRTNPMMIFSTPKMTSSATKLNSCSVPTCGIIFLSASVIVRSRNRKTRLSIRGQTSTRPVSSSHPLTRLTIGRTDQTNPPQIMASANSRP